MENFLFDLFLTLTFCQGKAPEYLPGFHEIPSCNIDDDSRMAVWQTNRNQQSFSHPEAFTRSQLGTTHSIAAPWQKAAPALSPISFAIIERNCWKVAPLQQKAKDPCKQFICVLAAEGVRRNNSGQLEKTGEILS